jgi:hypothetical protein
MVVVLARAVRAEQAERLARRDGQVDVVDGGVLAKPVADVLDDHGVRLGRGGDRLACLGLGY